MGELVERIADAIERVTVERQGHGFHLVTGRNDSEAFARAALSVLEPRIEALERDLGRVRAEERERAARILDKRAAMYRAKAERHDPSVDDTLTEYERFISNAEASEWGAAAIRSGDAG